MDGRKLVVVLGGTVPASGGTERMSMLLKAGTFPRDSSLILSPRVTGIEGFRVRVLRMTERRIDNGGKERVYETG